MTPSSLPASHPMGVTSSGQRPSERPPSNAQTFKLRLTTTSIKAALASMSPPYSRAGEEQQAIISWSTHDGSVLENRFKVIQRCTTAAHSMSGLLRVVAGSTLLLVLPTTGAPDRLASELLSGVIKYSESRLTPAAAIATLNDYIPPKLSDSESDTTRAVLRLA
ncbi:hypothetical protein ONZ45_g1063 [Pleurotus djamor]|nr:hypothetical protein ONZ45_g1063 [Pleurotus djamor]